MKPPQCSLITHIKKIEQEKRHEPTDGVVYFILYTLNIPLYTHSTLVCAAIVVTSDLVTSGWMDLEFYNWELWLRVTSHCTFSGRRLEIFELWVVLIAALVRVFSLSQLSDRMRLLLFHLQPCLRPRSSPVSFSFVFLWVFLCDLSQSAPSAVVACQFSLFKSRSVFFFTTCLFGVLCLGPFLQNLNVLMMSFVCILCCQHWETAEMTSCAFKLLFLKSLDISEVFLCR